MYYKKHTDIPRLPEEIKLELINLAETNLKNNVELYAWYRRYETENKNSLAYVNSPEDLSPGNTSGGVGFYSLDHSVSKLICDFYKKSNYSIMTNRYYALQVVTGGNFVAPHIDPVVSRTEGMLYLLKPGGSNVKTRWYEVKEEFKHLEDSQGAGIPYTRLDIVEEQCLEEDTWHWLNFNKIHSVENQETLRLFVWAMAE